MGKGVLLFYGGIGGMILAVILFVVTWILFENKKRKFLQKMDGEYE